MAGELHIELLGEFRICYMGKRVETVSSSRLQELLAWLILHRKAPQSRQHIAFKLWADSSEKQARTNLRNLLYQLRHALPEQDRFLTIDAKSLQWNPDAPFTLDVATFEQATSRAKQAKAGDDIEQHREALIKAASTYRGPLLPGCYAKWIEAPRKRLQQTYCHTLEELVDLLEIRREYGQAIKYARSWLDCAPFTEPAWRRLMQLYAKNGNRADALHTYQECLELFQEELDIQPGSQTRKIYKQILKSYKSPSNDKPSGKNLLTDESWPLVGREEEWEIIQKYWKKALSGQTQLLLLKGETGIGKSRLGLEFMNIVRRQGYTIAYSRCYEVPESLSYGPIIDWLHEELIRDQLETLDSVWLKELTRLLPELLVNHPGLEHPGPVSNPLQKRQLLEAVARGLTAGKKAMLLFLDDLQWCDGETMEWLSYLLHSRPSTNLMILGSYRPIEARGNKSLQRLLDDLHNGKQLREVSLGMLDEKETTELASHIANRSIEGEEAQLLYRETEGHPLFVVEMVRGGYRIEEIPVNNKDPGKNNGIDITTDTLPEKITEFISRRFHRLSKTGKKLLGLAAVIGRKCSFDLLLQASELREGELIEHLEELIRYNILREQQSGIYDFTHDKLREVAYSKLSDPRRQWLHKRVARAIERLPTVPQDGRQSQITYHYEQADRTRQTFRKDGDSNENVVLHPASRNRSSQGKNATRYLVRTLTSYIIFSLAILGFAWGLTNWLGLPGWTVTATIVVIAFGTPLAFAASVREARNRDPTISTRRPHLYKVAGWLERLPGHRLDWPTIIRWNALAYGSLALLVGSYMASRTLGIGPFATLLATGTLEEEDRIVLADFATKTVDSTMVYTVTEALRADLAQSPAVNLADLAMVTAVLQRMMRKKESPLDHRTAQEIAIREGIKAYLDPRINKIGSTFTLTASLVAAESGKRLVTVRESAENEDQIIGALERLSRDLRRQIGESLSSIRKSQGLFQYRTTSLEALNLFTAGTKSILSGNTERCVNLLSDALAIDSLFAAAYWQRGVCYNMMNSPPNKVVSDLHQAYNLRDQMTDWGRTGLLATYHLLVSGEYKRGIDILNTYLELNPSDSVENRYVLHFLGLHNLKTGDYKRAEELQRQLLKKGYLWPELHVPFWIWRNLINNQLYQGRIKKAEEINHEWEKNGTDKSNIQNLHTRADIAFADGDYNTANKNIQEWINRKNKNINDQISTSRHLANIAIAEGKLSKAISYLNDAMQANEKLLNINGYYNDGLKIATSHLWLTGDTTRARVMLDSVMSRYPQDSLEVLNREYHQLAIIFAQLGQPTRARRLLHEARGSIPSYTYGRFKYQSYRAHGWIAMAEGLLDDALAEFEQLKNRPTWQNQLDRLFARGLIYDLMGIPDSAIANYERLVNSPFKGWERFGWYQPRALERLGQLYEHKGNTKKAVNYYTRFTELWNDCDPELLSRVEAARNSLRKLSKQALENPEPILSSNSIAILPLENLSDKTEQEYFADGMTEALITELGQVSALNVINRHSSMQYKNSNKRLSDIAVELNVDIIVSGTVFRSGDQVRISVEMVNAQTGRTLLSESYQRNMRDALALQGKVAQAIAREIQTSIKPYEQIKPRATPSVNSEALEAYLKGRYYAQRYGKDLEKAIKYYRQAIEKDPGFAKAYSALAEVSFVSFDPEVFKRGKEAAYKAVELNPYMAESQAALGLAKMLEWNWSASESAFQKAIELNPSSSIAHQWYAQLLRQTQRPAEALNEARRAEELNPLSLIVKTMVGWVYHNQRRFDKAIDVYNEVLKLEPELGLAYYNKGLIFGIQGNGEKVIAMANKASSTELPLPELHTKWLKATGYALTDQHDLATKLLDDLTQQYGDIYPSRIAGIYHALGQDGKTLDWLERAYNNHEPFLPNIMTEPIFDKLRNHPRYQKIITRFNFPDQ